MLSAKTRNNDMNMIEGPLLGKVVRFVLPLMVTNLLQVFYNAADMIVVRLSSEPDAVGAIGTTGAMINLILSVFMGFAVGSTVMVSHYLGAGDDNAVSKTVHTSLFVSVIFGIAGCVIGLFLSEPILIWMGNSGNLLKLAAEYTRIYFVGVPLMSLTNYEIAILRAKGDTQTPFYILTLSGLVNCLLNLFFVLVCGMSVDGVAWATDIANGLSAVMLLAKLAKDDTALRFSFKKLCIDKIAMRGIIRIGLPAGIQGALFALSNMIIQSSIIQVNNATVSADSTYQPIVKGCSAGSNLEGFAYTATNSVYQAAVTFSGQNVGALKFDRVGKVMKCCYFVTGCIAVVFASFLIIFRSPLLSLYGVVDGEVGSLDHYAFSAAETRMFIMFTTYYLVAFMEVGSGILRGLGRSTTSTVVSLIGSCAFRIVWINTVFRLYPTLTVIFVSYPLSWGLTALVFLVCSLKIKKKMELRYATQPVNGNA